MSELEWECTPQKGLQARPCANRRVPLKEMPGVSMLYQPHRRIGLHHYEPGRVHEAFFDLVRVSDSGRRQASTSSGGYPKEAVA